MSYRRLEPFATFIGMIADTVDATRDGIEEDHSLAEAAFTSITLSLAENFKEKTFMSGIGQFIDSMRSERAWRAYAQNWTAGVLVPRNISQFSGATGPDVAETQDLISRIRSRSPLWNAGAPPRRNILGEPIDFRNVPGSRLLALEFGKSSSDIVTEEIARLGFGFEEPARRDWDIDLRDISTDDGQGFYDAWTERVGTIEIAGRTLRQALEETVSSEDYQALSPQGGSSQTPRVKLISRILSSYRSAAKGETIARSTEAQAAIEAYKYFLANPFKTAREAKSQGYTSTVVD